MENMGEKLVQARNERPIRETIVFRKEGHKFIPVTEVNCILCGHKVDWLSDHLSIKEFIISGMCQNCQDGTFNGE